MATIAISLAAGFAAQTVASWLQPTQVIDNGGLSDLSIPKSNYGVTIPQAWGTVMMAGNLIWGTHKEEVVKKKKRGKGGGGRVEKNRTYYGNCAWLFGYTPNSPAIGFKRVWMNGKVVYSTVGDAETINNGDDFASQYLRFYLGSNTQTPDPLLESLKPSSSYDYGLPHDPDEREAALIDLGLDPSTIYTPAYRYRSYCVAERLPLNDFGNQLPTLKAEIIFSSPCYLADIITDICLQAGLTANQIDVTGVAGIGVTGFYLDSVKKASEALQLLQQCYFFDVVQSQGKLIFISQSALKPTINLDNSNLATHVYGQARPNTYTEEPEYIEALPSEVDVNFIDPDLDYEENTAKARSQVSQSLEKKVYNLPIVLTADNAIALSEKILHQHYLTSKKYSFTLPPALSFLEIGDRLLLNNQTIQVTKIGLGANLLLNVSAKLFDAGSISTISVTRTVETGGYNLPLADNVITSAGDTTLLILDIPLIGDRDDERGVYLTGGGGSYWNGADIYVSINGSTYELVSGLDTYGVYGSANTVLGADVEVILDKGELASATTADLDAGYNKALVGDEIIQFETATLIATNTYTLSGLRRGLRGTEWVTSYSVGERFVLLTGENSYIERVTNSAIAPGQTLYFKALSNGQSLDSVNPVTITYQGNDLKPYAPTNIAASKDEAGNITITWDRRDRKAGEAIDLTKIPLSETREEYKLEIQLNTSIIRTVIIENNDYYNYLASEQVSDFGAIQFSITVNLYQVSTVVGDGYAATATLNPSLVAGTPVISSFSPVQGIEGDVIVLTGSSFTDVADVAINGVSCIFTINSDSQITLTVASGVSSGFIEVVKASGVGVSANPFIVATASSGGHLIQDETNIFTARTNLKFIGRVSVTDDDINDATVVDITEAVAAASGTFGEVSATTASLNQGDAENINLDLAAISLIREITVTQPSRLRLFGTDSDRTADTADVNTQLSIDEAIDLEFSSNLTRRFARGVMVNNLDESTANTIYGKLFNNSGAANSLDLTIKYYAIASIVQSGNIDLTTGLIAFYKFANNLSDSSGNNRDLSILTGTGVPTYPTGIAGKGFQGAIASSSNTVFYTGTSAFTYSLWVFSPSYNDDFLLGLPPTTWGQFAGTLTLYIHPSNGLRFVTNALSFFTTIPNQDNNWHHIVATYDGINTVKIYLNNSLANTQTGTLNIDGTQAEPFQIWHNETSFIPNNRTANKIIDAVGIWNRNLSESEITQLFNNPEFI